MSPMDWVDDGTLSAGVGLVLGAAGWMAGRRQRGATLDATNAQASQAIASAAQAITASAEQLLAPALTRLAAVEASNAALTLSVERWQSWGAEVVTRCRRAGVSLPDPPVLVRPHPVTP